MPTPRFVIVGAGLAGARAAETLRSEGFEGQVVLLGDEPDRPYERPGLSKGYLLGTSDRRSLDVHPLGWYDDHGIELRSSTRVEALDLPHQDVVLAGGDRLRFDRLLVATGATPRRLALPGADLDGIHYLRRVGDSDVLRAELTGAARRVVVVGGGWIGLEVAAAARTGGHDVTIIEPEPTVLHRALGLQLGDVFADLHRSHGVRLLLGTGAAEIRGHGGTIAAVVTGSGEVVEADLVVVGIGAVASVELALHAGLDVADGIRTDAALRTSHPAVVAAGDVVNAFNPRLGRSVRIEHWANALHTGPAAARTMLEQEVVYNRLPYFYTDQYDLGMEYSGYVGPEGFDRLVLRGDPASGAFLAFWLQGSRVLAGMSVNTWDVTADVQQLVHVDVPIDAAVLADPSVPLAEVALASR